jgi:DNA replication protein DnaC
MSYDRVHEGLDRLKLTGMARILDSAIQRWSKGDKDVLTLIEELISAEENEREHKRYESALKWSGFPYYKRIEEFDFSFQPSIDKRQIKELETMRFLYDKENVVFLGPPGVGKTHLAVGLGIRAIEEGKRCYFVNAITLVDKLKKAFADRSLQKHMRFYRSIDLLIIDELGYLPLDGEGAKLFFELIAQRYEKKSIILTSNRGFTEWDKIFSDEVIATAILDRLLHHCTIVNIRGKSYRLKEKKKEGLTKVSVLTERRGENVK